MPNERVAITDFTPGLFTEKLSGRFDMPNYVKGASQFDNWEASSQGALTMRPGTVYIANTEANAKARLIPYLCSPLAVFFIELTPGVSNGTMKFYDNTGVLRATLTTGVPYISASDIAELHFAQEAGNIYFAHRNYPPTVVSWGGAYTFTIQSLSITGNVGQLPFQSANNYPSAVSAINGRLMFAGSINEPQAIWGSRPFLPGDFTYFDTVSVTYTQIKPVAEWADIHYPETEEVTTTRDVINEGNAFKIELASDENEYILGMVADRDLVVSTTSSEWIIPGNVTAVNPSALLQSRHGGTRIQPIMVGNAIYLATSPRAIKQYSYVDQTAAWNAIDISFQSEALTGVILDMDFVSKPLSYLYCVLANGYIAVLTINQPLQTAGWRFIKTSGTVESLAVIPGSDGDDDIYISVLRGTSRTIERFSRPFTGQHLDCSETVTVTAGPIAPGLTHLEGLTVSAVQNGAVVGSGTVTSGNLSLPGVIVGSSVTVGIVFTATWKSMRLQNSKDGATGQTSLKHIPKLTARLYATTSLKIGRTAANLSTKTFTTPYTGDSEFVFPGTNDRDAYVFAIQDAPLAATITALLVEVE